MSSDITTTLISGAVSLICGFGSIILKDHLEQRRLRTDATSAGAAPPAPSASIPARLGTASALCGLALVIGFFGPAQLRYEVAGLYLFMWVDVVISLGLLAYFLRGRSRSPASYLLGVAALWIGMFAGLNAREGQINPDAYLVLLTCWGGASIVGLVAFAVVGMARGRRA